MQKTAHTLARFWAAFVVVGLLGAGSGLLIPLLAYQVSLASFLRSSRLMQINEQVAPPV